MKHHFIPKIFVVLCFAAIFVSCKEDQKPENVTYEISGNGSGMQEVPEVTTEGKSTVTGTYSNDSLTYTVTWSNISGDATMMHFHGPASQGENAPVMVPITGFTAATSGSYSGVATLTSAQDSALLSGKMYYNVHTELHPAGEVRAQLEVKRK